VYTSTVVVALCRHASNPTSKNAAGQQLMMVAGSRDDDGASIFCLSLFLGF
jgi:hypothetical protein